MVVLSLWVAVFVRATVRDVTLCLNFKEFISSKCRDEKVGIIFPGEAVAKAKYSKSAAAE